MYDSHSLFQVLEAIEDGIYIINQEYTVEYMNKAMVKLFGEGVGRKCYRLINCSNRTCPWCRAYEAFSGKQASMEVDVPTVGKSFQVLSMPLKNSDGTVSKLSVYKDISLRKQQEAKLKSTEADYRRLFENVGCGVFVSSKEGKFLDANSELLRMLGYESKEEFLEIDIGRDLYLRPKDRKAFQERIEREGRVVDYEVDFKRKDGTAIPVLLTGSVRHDASGRIAGYEGINVDQSQRKAMENELKEAHDFLNRVIQSSPNAIMAADMKGNIIIWNHAAEEILGYTSREIINKMHITDLYPEGLAYKVMKMLRSEQYGGQGRLNSYPIFFVRKDSSLIEGNLSATIIYDAGGREAASVGTFVDLEEQLAMERKLHQTQQQLLNSEKLAAMGRLTSQIAHELNNPLYGIMNALELTKTEIPPENKRRRILDMALSETERLTEMLRKMLTFSKPERAEKVPLDVNEVLDEILLLYGKQLRENSIKLNASFDAEPGLVLGSKEQLRQVFLNMINNARDAMPEGGSLDVMTSARDGRLLITIADTGIGVRKKDIAKIFDSFYTTKDSVKGVGLGLSVCYGFIKDHGGNIECESEPGHGATFTISLPLFEHEK
ncbi:MAG: PAS domain S-box protein [Desulfohalobiaceae bacterium]|nr:PAS domain S-box protein [Desulfohalobiaceae bacterium]